jgi:predicted nucleotidyltransferase
VPEKHDSIVDFLVELDYGKTSNAFHQYFDFKAGLEELLARPVDLVCYRSIRNPYFKREVDETKRTIYAA